MGCCQATLFLWSPSVADLSSHLIAISAYAREDIEALTLLLAHGADLTVKTNTDHYATLLEEAHILKKQKSVTYLQSIAK